MTQREPDVKKFASHVGSWLASDHPESDVVLSCRVRLARNLADYSFIPRLAPAAAEEVCAKLRDVLIDAKLDGETQFVPMTAASPLMRLMLRERHLISRDLAPSEEGLSAQPGRAVAFGSSETISVMINEEDHVRLQAIAGGFQLEAAWRHAQEIDRLLEARVPFAYTQKLGYLTGCPTNVGTGLRASVMMHLPCLSLVRPELEKVFAAAQKTGLAVRGTYGEGSRAAGDFYQISNQITLGRSEAQLVDDLAALVPCILDFERKVRATLDREQRAALKDRVGRSLGLLRTARAMHSETALAHLSNLRLGIHLGLFDGVGLGVLNELGVQVQKGHVQALAQEVLSGELLEASERDRLRSSLLRRRLAA
ncbi:MAG: protein arginine kinase [Planctomycetota bacterium]|nr:protein arginine kinase [Planctomycetota bacterium]